MAAIRSATSGDHVFIDSIDRLGQHKMDTLRHVTEFTNRSASVTFVKEGLLFTEHC